MTRFYYTNDNPFIAEWEDYMNNSKDEYIEIPEDIVGFGEINKFVKEKSGNIFYPTTSVSDLKTSDSKELERILANARVFSRAKLTIS